MNWVDRRHYLVAGKNILRLLKRGSRTGRAGTTAVEFAVLGVPFLMFFLFLFEVGLDFYMQTALDYVVAETSRRVQIGAGQSAASAAARERSSSLRVLAAIQRSVLSSAAPMPLASTVRICAAR